MADSSVSFVPRFNHVSNKMEWQVVSEDYDYNQEIATSCYGDMLHDTERNQKFGLALKKAINKMHSLGKEANVLDIGTGTGLLSMLAVKHGADSVVACESFLPMAECAIKIIEQNGFSGKIDVVKKHSTLLTVGPGNDMKQKANILVSEVFDTELIGEGAIKTFNHAKEHLLEDDCILIPSLGTIFVQLVECDLATKWNVLRDWKFGDNTYIKIPDDIKKCPGATAVHDIQLSQLKPHLFKPLSCCVPLFKFDWAGKDPVPTHRQIDKELLIIESGKAQVLFFWWELLMDPEGDIVLSCAPVWEHPYSKTKFILQQLSGFNLASCIPWRDHWMQAVYFFAEQREITRGDLITLNCYHDEFSYWFHINQARENSQVSEINATKSQRPACYCGVHFSISRTRIGALNCQRRQSFFITNAEELANPNDNFVLFGDMSFMGILLSKLGAKKIIALENSPPITKVVKSIYELNSVGNIQICGNMSEVINNLVINDSTKITISSEAFFRNSLLPWDNVSFWYMKEELARNIKLLHPNFKSSNITIFPSTAKMMACAIQFDDLWKIARRLNYCEGFNMTLFDELIEKAKSKTENYVEAQPLWEYPGIALTYAFTLFDFNFFDPIPTEPVKYEGKLSFPVSCHCDGFAIWMEYSHENSFLSTGPADDIVLNDYISWDVFERQGVHLLRKSAKVRQGDTLHYKAKFLPETGGFKFKFNIKSQMTG